MVCLCLVPSSRAEIMIETFFVPRRVARFFLSLFLFAAFLLLPFRVTGALPGPYTQSRLMLHTLVEIKAYGENAEVATEAALKEIERVNGLLNNYDPKSEISQINNSAGQKAVAISPETLEALEAAKHLAALSGGALDITIGPLLKLWGFAQEEPGSKVGPPLPDVLDQTRQLVDYRLIQLDAIKGTAMIAKRGMWIDVGSFTKGYVVDRAAQILKKQGITQALITAGGTILALGKKPSGASWRVGVRHPRKEGELLDTVSLGGGAISTSGDYERFYRHGGRRLCHIIDPRSGRPVEAVRSVSVIAPTAMASDALSTALFVLGTKEGLSLVKGLPGIEAMIVDQEGAVHCSPGWPIGKNKGN
jgi:thiamine biosynthesis lipoprotein